MNHRAKYIGQRSFRSKVMTRTHTTHTHTQRTDRKTRTTKAVGE